jgi:LacI family transcriptional regulator
MEKQPRRPKAISAQRTGATTIGDIAKASGVSKMTVSRVLGTGYVREETRERVLKAMAEMNYTPNRSARMLSGSAPMRFGILYNQPYSSYIVDFLLGAIDIASRLDVQLLSRGCRLDDDAASVLQDLLASGVDALILTPPLCDSEDLLAIMSGSGVPLLLISTDHPNCDASAIFIDERQAAREMTRLLIEMGHQRIGFIIGEPSLIASQSRLEGFRSALEEAGLPLDPTLLAQGLFTYRSGLEASTRLLTRDDPPTAIFASNDDMAVAAVMTAHRLGFDVPGELTVCGFDDSWIATSIYPELTTIRQPIRDMAFEGVTLLVELVQDARAGQPTTRRRQLAHELVVRQSSARRNAETIDTV